MSEEVKLKFYGLIKTAAKQGETLDYYAVAQLLETKEATLKRWVREFKKLDEDDSISKLIDVDQIMVDRIANELANELEEPEIWINPITGVIETKKLEESNNKEVTVTKLEEFKNGVKGLQLLNGELQATAGTLVHKIAAQASNTDLSTRDIASLASALSNIQNAFFNKPTTNILVDNSGQSDKSNSLLAAFKKDLSS